MSCPEVAVVADVDQAPRRWLEVADAIVTRRTQLSPQWIAETLERFPGAAIVAMDRGDGSVLLGLRDGSLVTAAGGRPAPIAAFLHAWLASGQPVAALDGVTVDIGWIRVGCRDEREQAAYLGRLDVRQPLVDQ